PARTAPVSPSARWRGRRPRTLSSGRPVVRLQSSSRAVVREVSTGDSRAERARRSPRVNYTVPALTYSSTMPNAGRPGGLRRRDLLKGCAAAGIGAITGGAAYGFMYERHHVGLTRATLEVSGWSEGLSGLRVGFITDVHRSRTVSHEFIAHAVDLL